MRTLKTPEEIFNELGEPHVYTRVHLKAVIIAAQRDALECVKICSDECKLENGYISEKMLYRAIEILIPKE